MPARRETLEEYARYPSESLSLELKSWLDLSTSEAQAKIVCSAIALRNQNGGFILIGFDDEARRPIHEGVPNAIDAAWHPDRIQELVLAYSSTAFEVWVHFVDLEGFRHPVIEIGAGVRTPVCAKRDLFSTGRTDGECLIKKGGVYVRSLTSNNRVSTTLAGMSDWEALVERCFDNREADIGRFVRRQLGSLDPQVMGTLAQFLGGFSRSNEGDPARDFLDLGWRRMTSSMATHGDEVPALGTWEVAAVIDGEVPNREATRSFLTLLDSLNPDFTGWPAWVNSRGFGPGSSTPYTFEDGYESLIQASSGRHWDFWRIEPRGRFYLWRVLTDDLEGGHGSAASTPGLDSGWTILRTAEAVAVSLRFARGLGCNRQETTVRYAMRWRHLNGRVLYSSNPARSMRGELISHQEEVVATCDVPLETPESALAPFVQRLVSKLFAAFSGYEVDSSVVEDLTTRLVERRL